VQRRARLQQEEVVPVVFVDREPHDLEAAGFGGAGELDVGEQRPVAAQPASRAQRVR
jgi:hypothetical protein